jgi:hypothetical protein
MFFPQIAALQFRCERQQGDVARTLDCHTKPALVLGTGAGRSPRHDLSSLLYEGLEHFGLLIVDEIDPIYTEPADLLFSEILPFASTWAGAGRRPPAALARRRAA